MPNLKILTGILVMALTLQGCSTEPVVKYSDRIVQTPSSLLERPTCVAYGVGSRAEFLPEAYLNNTACLGEFMNSFDARTFFEEKLLQEVGEVNE